MKHAYGIIVDKITSTQHIKIFRLTVMRDIMKCIKRVNCVSSLPINGKGIGLILCQVTHYSKIRSSVQLFGLMGYATRVLDK